MIASNFVKGFEMTEGAGDLLEEVVLPALVLPELEESERGAIVGEDCCEAVFLIRVAAGDMGFVEGGANVLVRPLRALRGMMRGGRERAG